MKILYGVAGEGMGHATRSKVTIDHLQQRGHEVLVASSGRALEFLRRSCPITVEIAELRIKYTDGQLDHVGSYALNMESAPTSIALAIKANADTERFAPEVAFTDFDPFVHAYAKIHSIPVMSIDNIHALTRLSHGPEITYGCEDDFRVGKGVTTFVAPWCDHYIVTTFFCPSVRAECVANTTIVPPILRNEILYAVPTAGDHVLVYQTQQTDSRLLDVLRGFSWQKFVVYGLNRDESAGNCTLKKFNDQSFIRDLSSARAVIANGGMSLLGEAVALCKPVYSIPVRRHPEQIMNARYLAYLRYGVTSEKIEPSTLAWFLDHLPEISAQPRSHDGNRALFEKVDQFLSASGS